jgi:hypothetical protein
MGIFPIIMNIVQFWLIDSIVKASAAAMAAQDIESTRQDRDPLFSAPAEGDDDQPLPRLETANLDSSHRSVSSLDLGLHTNPSYQTIITIPDEQILGPTSRRLLDTYAYPPSLSSSISSDRSSILNHHNKGPNAGVKKYRDLSPAQRSP